MTDVVWCSNKPSVSDTHSEVANTSVIFADRSYEDDKLGKKKMSFPFSAFFLSFLSCWKKKPDNVASKSPVFFHSIILCVFIFTPDSMEVKPKLPSKHTLPRRLAGNPELLKS